MALSPELTQYYDQLDEVFALPGWKALVEEAQQEIYQLQADALEANSWEDVNFMRGRAFQLALIVNMEATADSQRQLLEEEAAILAAEEAENGDV